MPSTVSVIVFTLVVVLLVLIGDSESSKKVHIKIVVPHIVKETHHTKTVLLKGKEDEHHHHKKEEPKVVIHKHEHVHKHKHDHGHKHGHTHGHKHDNKHDHKHHHKGEHKHKHEVKKIHGDHHESYHNSYNGHNFNSFSPRVQEDKQDYSFNFDPNPDIKSLSQDYHQGPKIQDHAKKQEFAYDEHYHGPLEELPNKGLLVKSSYKVTEKNPLDHTTTGYHEQYQFPHPLKYDSYDFAQLKTHKPDDGFTPFSPQYNVEQEEQSDNLEEEEEDGGGGLDDVKPENYENYVEYDYVSPDDYRRRSSDHVKIGKTYRRVQKTAFGDGEATNNNKRKIVVAGSKMRPIPIILRGGGTRM